MSTPPQDPFERHDSNAGSGASQQPPASAASAPQPPQPGYGSDPGTYAQQPPASAPQYGAPQYPPPHGQPAYGQPQYGQPQYAQPGYAQPGTKAPGTEKNWMNVTSLVCSLATIIIGVSFIPGIIFGHLGRAAAKRGEANNGGLGLAGLIVGYAFLVLGIIGIVLFFAFFGWLASECTGDSPASWCESNVSYTWEATA